MNVLKNLKNCSKHVPLIRNASTNTVIVQSDGHVTTIGINKPDKRNCVDSDTAERLKDAIAAFESDQNAYAGVLYGVGGNFCAGYDLNELANVGELDTRFPNETGSMGPTMRHIKKPMVAAISGYAVAGGLELALMCDLRVMEDNAVMGVYCRRFGVPLIDGGTVRLQAMVGLSRALDLILTGRSLTAKEAFECGLANRIVAVGTGLGQAINLAASLVKFPQNCLHADRNSTYNAAFSSSYERLLKFERENAAHVIKMESIEGAKKFMSGVGRHGTAHNLTSKEIPQWEAEEDAKSKL